MTDNAIKRSGVRFIHELAPGDEVIFLADGRVIVANPDRPPLLFDGDSMKEVVP